MIDGKFLSNYYAILLLGATVSALRAWVTQCLTWADGSAHEPVGGVPRRLDVLLHTRQGLDNFRVAHAEDTAIGRRHAA